MAMFLARADRRPGRAERHLVPAGFEALADALEVRSPSDDATDLDAVLREIGRSAAAEGQPVDDLLEDLAVTYRNLGGAETPPFAVVRQLTTAWADASLSYLHAISCEDPMTGLASLAHVRSRLSDIYRSARNNGNVGAPPYALLIVEIDWSRAEPSHLDKVMRLIDVAELVRTAYPGDETIGRLSRTRIVAVVPRHDDMGHAVAGLLGLLHGWERRSRLAARLWLEGLPPLADSAGVLLDELAR